MLNPDYTLENLLQLQTASIYIALLNKIESGIKVFCKDISISLFSFKNTFKIKNVKVITYTREVEFVCLSSK